MKKTYTILFLSTAILTFAQESKVIEEASKDGYYFKQSGDVIELWKGYPSAGDNNKSSFSSPNEVRVSKDAKGNKYWSIIDGSVVKVELASNTIPVKSEPKETVKTEYKEPVKIETENKNIDQIPEQKIKPLETGKTDIKILKPSSVDSIIISKPDTLLESKGKKLLKEIAPSKVSGDLSKEEEKVQEDTKVLEEVPVEEKSIIVEDASPKEEDTTNESNEVINNDPNEEIKVEQGDVGDVTDLFEKNYENMTGKEKKLYRKNEKRIMKQLEAELKKQRKEEK